MAEIEKERDKILKLARDQAENIIQQADKSGRFCFPRLASAYSKEAVVKACELIQGAFAGAI